MIKQSEDMILKFGILTNQKKDKDLQYTRQLLDILKKRGCTWCLQPEIAHIFGVNAGGNITECEYLFILGGDGTILGAARKYAAFGTKLIGINIGRLGFLSEILMHDLETSLDKLMRKDYFLDRRMMLECTSQSFPDTLCALNEFVMSDEAMPRVADIEFSINGHVADHYLGDGMIVSTPTGSTAYALSAGGPIVEPAAQCILITPICPHTLHSKSIILKDSDTVELRLLSGCKTACITADGQTTRMLEEGMSVKIQKAPYTADFVRFNDRNFFEILQIKLSGRDR